jgi:hypothetical protein
MHANDHTARRHTPGAQRTVDKLRKIGLQQAAGRDLESQLALQPGLCKLGALAQRVVEHPPGHLAHQARALRGAERLGLRNLPQFGINPAQAALESADAARLGIELRLEGQPERVLFQRVAQPRLVTQLALLALAMCGVINRGACGRTARNPCRELGIAHQ